MAEPQGTRSPSVDLPPQEVVRLVLDGCGGSAGNAALLLWEFGAEKLRRTAGDQAHLERLLGNELFAPLVGFERAELAPLEQIDDSARQEVTVFPEEGAAACYLITLKRSGHGEQSGCWLITGLEREWYQLPGG